MIRMIRLPRDPILQIRHSQDGVDASLMAANSNTQVIPSLSLIRAFGFRGLNFLDNGPDFCKPNCDHRSRQARIHGRPARSLPKEQTAAAHAAALGR